MRVTLLTNPQTKEEVTQIINSSGNEIVQCLSISRPFSEKTLQKEQSFYESFCKSSDIVISYCYPKKILIEKLGVPCVNFHPAPLPKYKGFAVYNFAILNEEKEWSVSLHHVSDKIDEGEIIDTRNVKINIEKETAFSLRQKSHKVMKEYLKDFCEDIETFLKKNTKENGAGKYYSKKMFESARIVDLDQESEMGILKKIRAFWCPPHEGVVIRLNGQKYALTKI